MENNIEPLSRRQITYVLLIIPIAWFISTFTMSLISPTYSWPLPLPFSVGNLIGLIVLIGFVIYGTNLKDERTSQVGDKATRNGFAFVLFVTPSALVILTLSGASLETVIVLLVVCLGMIAVAGISALYYYHK
ncbi:MAG: hypothetical protein ACTSQZ_03685 [Candidatus Thorarchaeota archaeon]